jgi:hypothetical protein
MEHYQHVSIKLLGQTTHQNINIGLEKILTCNATCLSQNLPFLQPFKFNFSQNPLKFSSVNHVETLNKLLWISLELCFSRFVPGRSIYAHISHWCPLTAIESMATNIMGSKPFERQSKKQVFKSTSLFLIKYCQLIPFVSIWVTQARIYITIYC